MTMSMTSYFDDKFQFLHHFHMSPVDFDKMPFYEYIEIRKRLADYLKKKKEQAESTSKDTQSKPNSKFKMPSFKMPKLNK